YPGYKKVLDGTSIAKGIGLEKIRGQCLHFNDWLSVLEGLAAKG
ncbi:MAG: DUF4276 family protein, partial [bacterium]|nr:DUF4276 family protein [bacterium]